MTEEASHEIKPPENTSEFTEAPTIHIRRAQKGVRPHRQPPEIGPVHRMLPRDSEGNLLSREK